MIKQRFFPVLVSFALICALSIPALADDNSSGLELEESPFEVVNEYEDVALEEDAEEEDVETGVSEDGGISADDDFEIDALDTLAEDEADNETTPDQQNDDPFAELDARAAASKGLIAEDTYLIRSVMGEKQLIDVAYGSMEDGGNIVVWEWNGGENQRWLITFDSAGYASIQSVASGLFLTVESSNRGANVCQRSGLPSEQERSQKWIIEQSTSGSGFTITSALSADLVIDLTMNTSKNGTNVIVWNANGGSNQSFLFVDATPEIQASSASIEEGYYTIQSSISSNVLDVAYASTSAGGNVIGWPANGGINQLIEVTREGDYYQLTVALSGMQIEVAGACPVSGTNVQQNQPSSQSSLFSIVDNGDGTFSFVNAATGLVLTMDGAASGANVYGCELTGDGNQRFTFNPVNELISSGLYEIIPATNSSLRLDVANASKTDGANILLWSSNSDQNQKWDIQLIPGKNNTYTIQSVSSGLFLAAEGNFAGANVGQKESDASDEQIQWIPMYYAGKIMFKNVSSGLMLDVASSGSTPGSNMEIWTQNHANAQRFTLVQTHPIKDGCYFIEFSNSTAQVLDIAFKSTTSGGNAISYANNKGPNQKWFFQRQSDGSYKILNAYSELPLALAGDSVASGTNVQQAASSSSNGQRWNLVYNHDGTFTIASALDSAAVVSVEGGTPSNAANVIIQPITSDGAHSFVFEPTSYTGGTLGLTGNQLDMYKRAQGYSSSTGWLIMIDNENCWVGVFRWYDGRWNYERYFRCSNGKYSTPTVRGIFYVGAKGYTFGSDQGHACYWYTQIYQDYLFHSTLYYPYSFDHLDSRLGMHLSNGCVRLQIDNAKFIYDNVPYNTKIVSYN